MRGHAVSIPAVMAWLWAWLWPALACPAAPLPVQLTDDIGDGDAQLFHPPGWAICDAAVLLPAAQAPGCGAGFGRGPARRWGE